MTIGFLLDAFLDEAQHISLTSALCKRVRYRKSTCQNCVDVCPDNAITLSPGPSINDNCSNCGLCQNACPTEVFQNDVDMDQVLLKQVETLLSKDPGKEKKCVFIHCNQAEKQDKTSQAIRCLGSMSENFFVGAALSGVNEMTLTKGHCSQCHLKNGEKLLSSAMKTSQALMESMRVEKFSLRLHEEQKDNNNDNNNEEQLTRREFFSKIVHRVTDSAPSSLTEQVDGKMSNKQLEMKDGIRLSPKRKMLHMLIKHNVRGNTKANVNQQAFPWKKMKVDEANCVACAICVNVCPTGALTKTFENNQIVRYLNNSLCTNCNLCQEACPEGVISFEEDYAVTDLIEDRTHVVARIDMTACAICGEISPARQGEICTTCEKRQISPMFMNV